MRVNTDELLRQASQFHSVIGVAAEARETVLRVARILAQEESLEDLSIHLNGLAQRIGEEARDLAKLQTALGQIAQTYADTENRVLDRVENNTASYQTYRPTVFSILQVIRWPEQLTGPTEMLDWTPWDG